LSQYQWLLALHVTVAFLFLGGAVVAGVLNVAALRSKRPSETAFFLGLIRFAVIVIGIGSIATLVLGLWLAHKGGFAYSSGWIVASLILWIAVGAMGGIGGKRDRETRVLAERLAGESDQPSPELRARLLDPTALALSYGSGVGVIVILALMIWKPGS
jgi:uncharacterized membrane protein